MSLKRFELFFKFSFIYIYIYLENLIENYNDIDFLGSFNKDLRKKKNIYSIHIQ